MTLKTRPFDAAEYLAPLSSRLEFLRLSIESDDAEHIGHSLEIIERARSMHGPAAIRTTAEYEQAITIINAIGDSEAHPCRAAGHDH